MDSEDMPDLGFDLGLGGTADDMLDEDDELENMLEDAFEQQVEAEEEAAGGAGPGPQSQAGLLSAVTESTLASLPRKPDGTIDQASLTAEQTRIYTTAASTLLTEHQQERYAAFRRSTLKEPLRQLMQVVLGLSTRVNPQDKTLLALSSVTKSFVGEVVEEARRVATERGHHGPLQPAHVYGAYQKLQEKGLVESAAAPSRNKLRL